MLTFFAVFPEDFAPFAEDRAPFGGDALEEFGLFAAEVLAEAVLFTECFLEVCLVSLPDRPLASFLPERAFGMRDGLPTFSSRIFRVLIFCL